MARRFFVLTRTLFSSFLRDWQSLLFTIAMPLIFLMIFGFLYGNNEGDRVVSVTILGDVDTVEQGELLAAVEEVGGMEVEEVASLSEMRESVGSLNTDMGLVWDGGNLVLYTNPVQIQNNGYYQQLATGIQNNLNKKRAGLVDLIGVDRRTVNETVSMSLAFLFPGIISLGVLSSGLFAITSSFMHYKDRNVLKRFTATPMRKSDFMAALMTTRILVSIVSAFLILLFGFLVFGVSLQIDWVLFIPYVLISTIIMMGFGSLVIMISKNAENATQISSILMVVMMFFSGIYFPTEFLPSYFQSISRFLPLSYITRGFRYTMGMESMVFNHFLVETGVLLLASLMLTGFATIKGRWTER